jgi:hypothetical protein
LIAGLNVSQAKLSEVAKLIFLKRWKNTWNVERQEVSGEKLRS